MRARRHGVHPTRRLVALPHLCGLPEGDVRMTNLDLAQLLKDEMGRLTEEISAATRRRNILQGAATRLRLGVPQTVVAAELEAQGEQLDRSWIDRKEETP